MYSYGPGIYTSLLTTGTLLGFVALLINRKIGLKINFIITIGWLLRYFEYSGYLIFYDINNNGRWLLVAIPLILSFILFGLTFKALIEDRERTFRLSWIGISFLVFLSIGLFSFIRKPHVNEINCWYYIDNNKDDFKITFAKSPDHKFEAYSNSKELKEIILQEGMTYKSRDGYYCPESKVKVITRFKKIIGIKVLGFRNSEINKVINFEKPFDIDIKTINGDKGILEPRFKWGD